MVIGPAVQQALRDRAQQMIALRELRCGRPNRQERAETHAGAGIDAGTAIASLRSMLEVLAPREIRELVDAVERFAERERASCTIERLFA